MTDNQTTPCIGNDPACPCQDGDACHYIDLPGSPAMTPKPYTVQQAVADLIKLAESKDYEAAHGEADRILCWLLLALGYRHVVEAYDKIRKEYA